MELKVQTKRDEDKSVYGKLADVGVYSFNDDDFGNRRDDIKEELSDYLTNAEIGGMNLTAKRELLLKQAMRKLRFVWYHGPSGKGADKPRFYRALSACRSIVLMVEEDIDTDCSDEDVYLVGRDHLAQLDKIIQATFGADNTSIMKSFTVQAQGLPQESRIPRERDDGLNLGEAARRNREKNQNG